MTNLAFNDLHLIKEFNNTPGFFIFQIISSIFIVNFIFSIIYYSIYLNNKKSFIKTDTDNIIYTDFLYFSNTLFFSLGYNIYPSSSLTKMLAITQLYTSFIIVALLIK